MEDLPLATCRHQTCFPLVPCFLCALAAFIYALLISSIGYGDLTPTLPWGKMLTIFFGLHGIVILLSRYDRIREVRIWRWFAK